MWEVLYCLRGDIDCFFVFLTMWPGTLGLPRKAKDCVVLIDCFIGLAGLTYLSFLAGEGRAASYFLMDCFLGETADTGLLLETNYSARTSSRTCNRVDALCS